MYIKFWVFFCKKKPKVYSARSQRLDGVESSYLDHIPTWTSNLRKRKNFVSPTTLTPSHHLLGERKIFKKRENLKILILALIPLRHLF